MKFARRTQWDTSLSPYSSAITAARSRGLPLTDLTESNFTRAALFDAAPLIALLGHPRAAEYAPQPLGHPTARAAVSAYYQARGQTVAPSQIALTASTSEAYGFLFKLLCERGDRVLVPAPSYPLFDFLAASEDITLTKYPLAREHNFRIDLHALEQAIDERTTAILLVHPNNPTGSLVRKDEAQTIEQIAAERGLALIVDEVFSDYAFPPPKPQTAHQTSPQNDPLPSFAGRAKALTFVLSGLSKVLALPQLKLAWIAASGPEPILHEALSRLEIIADTYLSVGTPVQLALPELLAARPAIQTAILQRAAHNLRTLDAALRALGPAAPVRRFPIDAGLYAILEVPRILTDDEWIELLLERAQTILHPGYFFEFDREGFLIVSLLSRPDAFPQAIARTLAVIAEQCASP